MNPNKAKNKIGRTTPPMLRQLLVGLLFASAVTGYASAGYLVIQARAAIGSAITETLEEHSEEVNTAAELLNTMIPERFEIPTDKNFTGVRDLFRDPALENQEFMSLTFQGTLAGISGGAIAIINDEPMATGTVTQGVKIVSITDRFVTLEYQGETKELRVGETVSVLIGD